MGQNRWYGEMPMWKDYVTYFPVGYGISAGSEPKEEYRVWNDNQVHLDVYENENAPVKVILLHGVGGNGRVVSFIGAPLYLMGYEVIAPDLPGYGLTEMQQRSWDYRSWIDLVHDLVEREVQRDDRPIVLFGLSAGGMLAYQEASGTDAVRGVAATCFLDLREPDVLTSSAISPRLARIGVPIIRRLAAIVPMFPLPMKAVANMRALANNDQLLNLLIHDRTSAGARVPIGLVASMSSVSPPVEPEDFFDKPVLLVHPGEDRWVDVRLSRIFFDRLACDKELVILEGAGHLPNERKGLDQMRNALRTFLDKVVERSRGLSIAPPVSPSHPQGNSGKQLRT